ncbi:uncharacterized protein HMPREF1541_05305 [Cyphellophora europaea CBS 101466]|uniref:RING-type domain-containing protein n=1 Tax=Cyphellophora europaea (strain CBS 101466) TaxID=1220924 RepID=W2RTL2_CYPE1|nr:uncharacterized protein HMPREF1541_05305 [Cyphellophora europaea CBS 101466]ETN39083.1 hypothetical protein HMPREF1541_05305 [Cyphellophora europaea CBS 101466]
MSRSQDTVIDDEEDTCPLCIEEFDLSDKNFRPCPCGYQICQFCFNSLKTTYEKSTCPNCRRPYDEKTIQYKIPTAEEFKADQANKNKKQIAARRKETEKREVETSSRRNLAGVRVKQQNLVYVIGLVPQTKDESALLQTLRGPEYFGQYGDIDKIVVSKAKPGAPNQGVGVYVTYARKEDAALCIQTVDGSMNGDRMLRAQFGTTKYCSAFLRGETCQNKNCSFLHDAGEDGQTSSLQGEAHAPKPKSATIMVPPPRPESTTHSISSQPMARQGSKDSEGHKDSTDASALPSSASWANAPSAAKVRRTSQSTSRDTPSPRLAHTAPTSQTQPQNPEAKGKQTAAAQPVSEPSKSIARSSLPPTRAKSKAPSSDPIQALFDHLLETSSRPFQFVFSDACLSDEEKERLKDFPCLIDPYGGAKRRAMQDKEEAERARLESDAKTKLEAQAKSAAEDALDDENMGAGSLALGGEPEDNPRSSSARGAIGRPTAGSAFMAEQFATMNLNPRSLTPQQRQQMALLSGNVQQAPGLQPPSQNTAFEMSDFDRSAPQFSQAQYDQIRSHQRHGSRYFNSETKPSGSRFQGQQQSQQQQQQQQQQQGFYSSGVQGPPPGLPASGTPPVSGGGMFAHGQNFTNPGFGAGKDANTDLHMRGRSGTGAGPDAKRELLLSLQDNPLRSPPQSSAPAPAPGLFNPLYGQYSGAYQDPGLVKQRKKGKKHRHANTSSSGGGVEHLADPSIVQARIHQGQGSNTGQGQGLYSGGNQVHDKNFPPLPVRTETQPSVLHSRVSSFQSRSSTPRVPPGFESHVQPPIGSISGSGVATPDRKGTPVDSKIQRIVSTTVIPAVPDLPIAPRTSTPKPSKDVTRGKEVKAPNDQVITGSGGEMNNSDISLGSPKPRMRQPALPDKKDPVGGQNEALTTSPAKTPPSKASAKASSIGQKKPTKIDIPIAAKSTDVDKPTTPTQTTALEAQSIVTPSATESPRASTPATTTSERERVPGPRPKTLRLTTTNTTKPVTPGVEQVLPSATIEKSTPVSTVTVPTKDPHHFPHLPSRQHSISSAPRLDKDSRPSTPMSEQSHPTSTTHSRMLSEVASRSSTPPPGGSIVGSAPERVKSKNQLKKERREKSKAKEKKPIPDQVPDGSVAPSPVKGTPTTEEVGPIVSRQKKQKKEKTKKVYDPPSAKTSNDAKKKEESQEKIQEQVENQEATKTKVEVTPEPAIIESETPTELEPEREPIETSYTVADFYADLAKANAPSMQALLAKKTASFDKIFSHLLADGDITKDHPLLNPPSLTSKEYRLPGDSRKGQEYLDAHGYTTTSAFGYVYVPRSQRRELLDGSHIKIGEEVAANGKEDLLKNCLITPSGTVMRHLTSKEADRAIELEDRRAYYREEYGDDVGGMHALEARLENDDNINLEGGPEEIVRRGESKGVIWVYEEGDDDDDVDPGDETEEEILEAGEYDDEEEVWEGDDDYDDDDDEEDAFDHSTNVARERKVNLHAMTHEELQKRIAETQREVDASRREMERLDKTMAKGNKDVAKFRDRTLKSL